MAFRDVEPPRDFHERAALAKKALTEFDLDVEVWIDDEGDQSRALFGDLPHSAIVVDEVGTVKLKLSWCDPEVLAATLPEIERDRMVISQEMAKASDHFLKRIEAAPHADEPATGPALHHRAVMLAHLAMTHTDHPARKAWLEELANGGPAWQRAWAEQRMRPSDAPNDDGNDNDDGDATERKGDGERTESATARAGPR